jgi:hypothetical protein
VTLSKALAETRQHEEEIRQRTNWYGQACKLALPEVTAEQAAGADEVAEFANRKQASGVPASPSRSTFQPAVSTSIANAKD